MCESVNDAEIGQTRMAEINIESTRKYVLVAEKEFDHIF